MLGESKVGVARYLADHGGAPVRSLADVIAFDCQHADIMMPLLAQEVLRRAHAFGQVTQARLPQSFAETQEG